MIGAMPETATIVPVEEGWLVRGARGLEVVVGDLREATYAIARLIEPDHWYEVTRSLVLVDPSGVPVHAFTVFFDWNNDDARVRALAGEVAPEGCRWYLEGQGVHFLRPGSTRLDAIAALAAEFRDNYGLTIDFGYEKDEWDGEPDRIVHLLLNAINRAASSGIDEHQLMQFVTVALGNRVGVPEEPSKTH